MRAAGTRAGAETKQGYIEVRTDDVQCSHGERYGTTKVKLLGRSLSAAETLPLIECWSGEVSDEGKAESIRHVLTTMATSVPKGNPQKFLPLQSTHPAHAGCKPQGAYENIRICRIVAFSPSLPPITFSKVRQRQHDGSEAARDPTTAYTAPTAESSPTVDITEGHRPLSDTK